MSLSSDLCQLDNLKKENTHLAHLSCPNLESVTAKTNIPNRALEILDRKNDRILPQTQHASLSTPDSSQTESEDFSPLLHRRQRLHNKEVKLPKFSFHSEEYGKLPLEIRSAGLVSKPVFDLVGPRSLPVTPKLSVHPNTPSPLVMTSKAQKVSSQAASLHQQTPVSFIQKTIIKSSSASGLSLLIPSEDYSSLSIQSPGGSSSASSRDVSPCRDLAPLISSLSPPIIVRRGPKGFGFTIRAIRVYFGDSDFYTVHHLVMEVDQGSPAFDAGTLVYKKTQIFLNTFYKIDILGLRPGDLVTHVNGESVQGLFHTQVLQLLISGGEAVTLRATALETTSIKTGGRRRDPHAIKQARKTFLNKPRSKARRDEKIRRKSSLFSKLSRKKATAEMQQLSMGHSKALREMSGVMSMSMVLSPSTLNQSSNADFLSDSSSPGDSTPCSPASSSG
jgi:microtubule-associated serine/threonine kinase